jgi:(R)-2-hydroxyacyl-CoA dehydratese activating ATPase
MAFIGIDLGSRTAKYVILDQNNSILAFKVMAGGVNPLEKLRCALHKEGALQEGCSQDIVATGYGRHTAQGDLAEQTITEIKAFALGAHYLHPRARMVIDIGGQDTKIIALDGDGSFENFIINDRCAAGTGRFLEVMANSFEIEIGEFGSFALKASTLIKINSMCTVFAESEVISLLAKGEDPASIALGIHQSIVERIEPMIKRVGVSEPILFAGGGALNPCLVNLLGKRLGSNLIVPENPQIVGALGAALHRSKESKEK